MTLLMREREIAEENFEEGIKQGVKEGIRQSIIKQIEMLKRLNIPKEVIISEIVKDYDISKDEVEKYL